MKLNFNNWNILYDPYTDFLQVYSPIFSNTNKKNIIKRERENIKVVLDKKIGHPLLIEVSFAETLFKSNLENWTKKQIFNFLENNLKGKYEKID